MEATLHFGKNSTEYQKVELRAGDKHLPSMCESLDLVTQHHTKKLNQKK